jgi:2,3-dihydroxybenzoate decarboxylase
MAMPTKKIALEEAFTVAAFKDREDAMVAAINPEWGAYVSERIGDLTDQRLEDMDSSGIDMQVLSLTSPGIQGMTDTDAAISTAKQANDLVAEVVREHPTRFAAFAALPCQDPGAAVAELDRAVNELGLCGALINGHTNGVYLDDQKFWGLWELSESLHVPIYIHPTDPPTPFACCSGYPLHGPTFGWAFETGTHALRIILAGVFDRFPGARLMIGHMGEFLPFSLMRIDDRYDFSEAHHVITRPPSYYVKNNLLVTTSGVNDTAPLLCTMSVMGVERVLFAVDYPYQHNQPAVDFIDTAPISDHDRNLICYGNAERILKLR